MMRKLWILGVLLLVVGSGGSQAGGREQGPFQVRQLSNGMQVLLREDHSTPLVSVMIFVRAGSVSEDASTAGMSHFLEHMLFDGTKNRTREEIKDLFDRLGGYTNAFTREEYTAYMVVMPKDFAADGTLIQADMLVNSIFPEDELVKERNVVLEEMKKDRDNPYYLSQESFTAAYFKETPYANPVLGFENSIKSVPRSTVISYYRRFYVPNNMIAIVMGDFSEEKMVATLEKAYGWVRARTLPALPGISFSPPRGVTRETNEADTKNTYLWMGFPAPLVTQADAPAFDLLSRLLIGGEDSRIYRAVLGGDKPLADQVEGGYETYRSASRFYVLGILSEQTNVDQVIALVQRELERVRREKVDPKELERAKVAYRVRDAFDNESFMYQEMDVANWLSIADYGYKQLYYDRISKVRPEDIRRVASKYLSGRDCLISILQPKSSSESKSATSTSTANIEKKVLDNGLVLIAKQDPASHVTATHVLVRNRVRLEPLGKEGIANFVSQMLLEGVAGRDGDQVAKEIAETGARVKVVDDPHIPYDDYYESRGYSYVRMETIEEFTDRGLNLLSDMLQRASFPPGSVEKIRGMTLGMIKRNEDNTGKVDKNLFFRTLFADTPYQNSILGNKESVSSFTRDDLVSYYRSAYSPDNLILSIVGSKPPRELIALLESRLKDIKRGEVGGTAWDSSTPRGKGTVTREMKKEQAYIYVGNALPGPQNDDVPALEVMSSILSDRLGKNLREKQGLAYSVGAAVDFVPEVGWFYVGMGTRNENVERAVKGIRSEIERIQQEPVKEDELATAVNSYWGHLLRFHQSHIGQAYYLGLYEYLGKGYEYDLGFIGDLRKVTPADVQRVAREHLDPARFVTAIAGDI